MARELPSELGDRLATRRPVSRALGLAVTLVPSIVLAAPLVLLEDGWPFAIGTAVLLWAFLTLFLGEVLGFRHHVHEHGIVSESSRPYRRRVIPFHSVEPDSLRMDGYHRSDGTWRDSRDRRYRQVPGRPTLRVRGLRADRATDLALGRTTWNAAPYETLTIAGRDHGQRPTEPVEWVLGWPRGVDDVAWLRSLVLKSQATAHMGGPDAVQ